MCWVCYVNDWTSLVSIWFYWKMHSIKTVVISTQHNYKVYNIKTEIVNKDHKIINQQIRLKVNCWNINKSRNLNIEGFCFRSNLLKQKCKTKLYTQISNTQQSSNRYININKPIFISRTQTDRKWHQAHNNSKTTKTKRYIKGFSFTATNRGGGGEKCGGGRTGVI